MTASSGPGFVLRHDFAEELAPVARPARAAPAPSPRLLVLNESIAGILGLDPTELREPRGLRLLTGEQPPPGARPVAQVYAGHQWGVFKPILGDGRAMLLGERALSDGSVLDLHLKGIGPTSMSRIDGFAGIAPMLREYLMGEAMHALGVPTTRALAVVATGAEHLRDNVPVPGAVLSRVARSHLRIGSFEFARASGDESLLRRMADHAIRRLYPSAHDTSAPYRSLLFSVAEAHAVLTADWTRLGFVHGVLSTDNVLISGETIDYGPCAFLDAYEPGAWFSSIDREGRYAYDRQSVIMAWNLARLGDALAPLLGRDDTEAGEVVAEAVERFTVQFERRRLEAFRGKLGFDGAADGGARDGAASNPAVPDDVVVELVTGVLDLLQAEHVDFTGFFRALANAAAGDDVPLFALVPDRARLGRWLGEWRGYRPSVSVLRSANPVYIPRNRLLDDALEQAAAGELEAFLELLDLVSHPFEERDEVEGEYALPSPVHGAVHRTFCGT